MNPVTVFNSFLPTEAQLVCARLEIAGFHPMVNHEAAALWTTGSAATTGGILVQVPDVEADEARQFLDDFAAPAQ